MPLASSSLGLPRAHLFAGSLPTTQRPSWMGTFATLTREKPEAPRARLNAPAALVCSAGEGAEKARVKAGRCRAW